MVKCSIFYYSCKCTMLSWNCCENNFIYEIYFKSSEKKEKVTIKRYVWEKYIRQTY